MSILSWDIHIHLCIHTQLHVHFSVSVILRLSVRFAIRRCSTQKNLI